MATPWDRPGDGLAKLRDAAIAAQFADTIGPFSPFWRTKLKALGLKGAEVKKLETLQRISPAGERDVCPDGDPAGAAALVARADETGWALHSPGNHLRAGLWTRTFRPGDFKRTVEAATRPTSYHFGGVGMTFPIASTRNDLDLVARAGARMWAVLGLTSEDVLVSAVPVSQRLDHVALAYAAIGAGAPALAPGADTDEVADTLGMLPATVVALPARTAVEVLEELLPLPETVRTLLLVGGPTEAERAAVTELAGGLRVLGVWGPPDGRVLYAESSAGSGYVTYPDLDHWETIDPDTGALSPGGGELCLTQLGFRGSALVRWRTGTLVDGPITTSGPDGRSVPRLPSALRSGALVPSLALGGGAARAVDLRALSAVLTARGDLAAFRVDVGTSARTGEGQLIVTIAPRGGADPASTAAAVAGDTRRATGARVTQVVVDESLG